MSDTGARPPTESEIEDFSLVRNDVLFRLQRRVGLVPATGLGLVRRALFWSMLGWLPIAVWAFYVQRALPGATEEPLLAHFGVHARLLIAVPLFIFAEGTAHAMMRRMLAQFTRAGLVVEETRAAFESAVARTVRLRDASLPWIIIFALVLGYVTMSGWIVHTHEADWDAASLAEADVGFGGLWYLYVGRTIYLTLLLAWLWRAALLTVLFRRIARLDLSLVPTHADRVGGLGFLEILPGAFALVALGLGTVLASRWAHDALYHGLELSSVRLEMAGFAVAVVVAFCLPLLAFHAPLRRAKRQALLDYGALVARHGRLFRQRWIEGRDVGEQPLLEAPELGPVADAGTLFDTVRSMRTFAISRVSAMPLVLAAAIPIIAVLSLEVPLKDLLLRLVKAIL